MAIVKLIQLKKCSECGDSVSTCRKCGDFFAPDEHIICNNGYHCCKACCKE